MLLDLVASCWILLDVIVCLWMPTSSLIDALECQHHGGGGAGKIALWVGKIALWVLVQDYHVLWCSIGIAVVGINISNSYTSIPLPFHIACCGWRALDA